MESSLIRVIKKHTPEVVKRRSRPLRTLLARYRCPVCDARVNAFRPLPEYYSENLQKYGWPYGLDGAETCNHLGYQCPSCLASDRDRLYALYLMTCFHSSLPNPVTRIVDFAPSTTLSNFIRRQIASSKREISYRTADAFADGVDDRVDITDMQIYEDGQFDFFLCSHVLEHVPDDRKALGELYRILRPGGRGILMVPIILSLNQIDEDPTVADEGERWRRFGQDDHVRIYSKNGFIERVAESGFLIHQYGKEFFGEDLFVRTGITSQSVLYVLEK